MSAETGGLVAVGARILVAEEKVFITQVGEDGKLHRVAGDLEFCRWGRVLSVGEAVVGDIQVGDLVAFGSVDGSEEAGGLRYGDAEMVMVPESECLAVLGERDDRDGSDEMEEDDG